MLASTAHAERLAALKGALLRRQALETQSLEAKLNLLGDIARFDYPVDYRARDAARLEALSLEAFKALSERTLRADAMDYVVVGDADTQEAGLSALGFGAPKRVPAFD